MNAAVNILIQKLSSPDQTAKNAAEALVTQASKHGTKMSSAVEDLVPYLKHRDFGVRAAIAAALGRVGTQEALSHLILSLISLPQSELRTKCGYSCWADEPLYYWIIEGLGENKHSKTGDILLSIIKNKNLDKSIRSTAMKQISYFDDDDYDLGNTDELIEILAEFANSKDAAISEGAIRLLGQL